MSPGCQRISSRKAANAVCATATPSRISVSESVAINSGGETKVAAATAPGPGGAPPPPPPPAPGGGGRPPQNPAPGGGRASDPRGSKVAPTNVYDRSARPIPEIDPSDQFFSDREAEGRGLPLILLYDRSVRPFPELAGPIDYKNDRVDHPVSSDVPMETYVSVLDIYWSPLSILKLIGPINFFRDRKP